MSGRTLYDKIWDTHKVEGDASRALIYIDRHLVHEVTSPQAFEGLRRAGRKLRAPERSLAVADHNVPTDPNARNASGGLTIADPESRAQVDALRRNCAEFGITFYDMDDPRRGIVHVIGPEQGFALPGMTVICGDSHTSTHGAFGAWAWGVGGSQVEHALATQTLPMRKAQNMRVRIDGALGEGMTAKDLALAIIGTIGAAGATGCVIEYDGAAVRGLSMEGRMTLANMSIEAGARAGLIAPDATTEAWLEGRPLAPKAGAAWHAACAYWRTLRTDEDAVFDKETVLNVEDLAPLITWGTSPQDVASVGSKVPDPAKVEDPARADAMRRALAYMALTPDTPMTDIPIDRVFIGSCTNGRIEDIRAVAAVARGRKTAESVRAMVVPGSGLVKAQAEAEGLDGILRAAGFEWREPGCSMCLAMNADKLRDGERCASTSNRNFEGRQGRGGRTHLVSPAMAAAAACAGRFVDVRAPEWRPRG